MDVKKAKFFIALILVVTLFCLASISGAAYVYKSVYFFRTVSPLETSQFTIFHKEFNADTKSWLIGVVDEDNSMVGSFSCPREPINNNPDLFYKINNLTSLSGNTRVAYSFDHLINCVKVITLPDLDKSAQVSL